MTRKLFLALALLAIASSAMAQTTKRAFVASTGTDTGACNSTAAACRTLQYAHDQAVSGGEVNVLDAAGYGSVIITKAITIEGHGLASITPAAGGVAATINAQPTDRVSLRGVLIDGLGGGQEGVQFNSGAGLQIIDCRVWGMVGSAVDFKPAAGGKLDIAKTLLAGSDTGLRIAPAGSGDVAAAVDDTELVQNATAGVSADGSGQSSGAFHVLLSRVRLSNNATGVNASGGNAEVTVWGSTLANNATQTSGSVSVATGSSVIYP